jgi:hypothetical protein
LKDAEAVQFLRQLLGSLETHDRGGELLLVCAPVGPCQLCVVTNQPVLHVTHTARDVFERLALVRRRIEERSHETSVVKEILLCDRSGANTDDSAFRGALSTREDPDRVAGWPRTSFAMPATDSRRWCMNPVA